MTDKNLNQKANIFKKIQIHRLQTDLSIVKNEVIKNTPTVSNSTDGFIKSLFTSASNEIKVGKTKLLLEKKAAIEDEIQRFEQSNTHIMNIEQPDKLKKMIDSCFESDLYDLERTLFSISVIFDEEYHYEYNDIGLAVVSCLIWGNEQSLISTKNSIGVIYKDLARQPLSTNQKFILGGASALLLFTAAVPALAIGTGLAAPGITSGLAGFGGVLGGTMIEGVGLIAVAEALLDGALIGFTYALLDNHNKNAVKKSFREMNFNSVAQMLAIKCYIMSVAKQAMPKEEFKEKTSELLQMVSDLKSDTDYVLLVEKDNIEENKKKIHVFHNLDNKLSKILC